MGEAVITRKGSKSAGSFNNLKVKIYTENGNFNVPKTGSYMVRIFGAGGWHNKGGGGGGWMNNGIINLNKGDIVSITVGQPNIGNAGGTTFFGSYMSANGGEAGKVNGDGGNGGSGGGGARQFHNGGIGFQFGGGGGGGGEKSGWNNTQSVGGSGGNGGMWGGGGGCSGYGYAGNAKGVSTVSVGKYGIGGIYGGNGGTGELDAMPGTNTIGLGLEYEGYGMNGSHETTVSNNSYTKCTSGGAGGGGYGGNGGNGLKGSYATNGSGYVYFKGGGGGGGYGANGGSTIYGYSDTGSAGGGGGGYGNDGYNADDDGGGGGGYGSAGFGHGGTYNAYGYHINAKSGICIIQYIV